MGHRTNAVGRADDDRVIPQHDGDPAEALQAVLDATAPMGIKGERAPQFSMVALDVAKDADLVSLKRLLVDQEADGRWSYDEGCVSQEWLQL